MRKVVLLTAMALLAVGVIAVINNFGLVSRTERLQEGILDLGGTSRDNLRPSILAGEWLFYPDRFIDPRHPDAGSATSPAGSGPRTIPVPSSWGDYAPGGTKLPSMGHASYRLIVQLPEPGSYSLSLDNVYTAYRLYVNGELLAEAGRTSEDDRLGRGQFRDMTATFRSDTGTADIILHISNYHHPRAGLLIAPVLGLPQQIYRFSIVSHGTALFLIGVMVIAALFILFYYGRPNPDPAIPLFAIFSFSQAVKTLASSTLLVHFIAGIPTELVVKLEYLPLAVGTGAFLWYTLHAFPGILNRTGVRLICLVSAIYILTIIVTPMRIYTRLLAPYAVVIALSAIWWTVALVVARIRRRIVSDYIIFGTFVMIFSILNHLFYYFSGATNLFANEISAFGIAFFIFTHYYEFSSKFLYAYAFSRELSEDLEQKVAERTRQLNRLNEQLSRMASTDELTGLANRTELYRLISAENERHNREELPGTPYSVLFIDLDNFKFFNDQYTHEAGDAVLRYFSSGLRQMFPEDSGITIFRIGGDEFILFLPGIDRPGARTAAEMILSGLPEVNAQIEAFISGPMELDLLNPELHRLSCSIGIAEHQEGILDIEYLIQQADAALLEAKRLGKNRWAEVPPEAEGEPWPAATNLPDTR